MAAVVCNTSSWTALRVLFRNTFPPTVLCFTSEPLTTGFVEGTLAAFEGFSPSSSAVFKKKKVSFDDLTPSVRNVALSGPTRTVLTRCSAYLPQVCHEMIARMMNRTHFFPDSSTRSENPSTRLNAMFVSSWRSFLGKKTYAAFLNSIPIYDAINFP